MVEAGEKEPGERQLRPSHPPHTPDLRAAACGHSLGTEWPCAQALIRVVLFYLIHQLLARG